MYVCCRDARVGGIGSRSRCTEVLINAATASERETRVNALYVFLFCFESRHRVTQIRGQIRGSIVVSISACHAEDPGSIPGRGV